MPHTDVVDAEFHLKPSPAPPPARLCVEEERDILGREVDRLSIESIDLQGELEETRRELERARHKLGTALAERRVAEREKTQALRERDEERSDRKAHRDELKAIHQLLAGQGEKPARDIKTPLAAAEDVLALLQQLRGQLEQARADRGEHVRELGAIYDLLASEGEEDAQELETPTAAAEEVIRCLRELRRRASDRATVAALVHRSWCTKLHSDPASEDLAAADAIIAHVLGKPVPRSDAEGGQAS